jgi:VIT1/CCC1 family predicted Fe2+/Mn2+ transporter
VSLERSKRIGAQVLRALQRPAVLIALSHDERGALSDLVGELIELNQRLERCESKLQELEEWQRAKSAT